MGSGRDKKKKVYMQWRVSHCVEPVLLSLFFFFSQAKAKAGEVTVGGGAVKVCQYCISMRTSFLLCDNAEVLFYCQYRLIAHDDIYSFQTDRKTEKNEAKKA